MEILFGNVIHRDKSYEEEKGYKFVGLTVFSFIK